jgi:hypothetical protein
MHLELLGVGAGGLHEQVARAEAEQPVAEQVAAPLRDDHPHGVVGHLAAADLLVHPQLPGGEDHVHPSVEEQDDHEPEDQDRHGNGQVAERVNVHVGVDRGLEEVIPPARQTQDDRH